VTTIAQSVKRLATDRKALGSNPGEARFSTNFQTVSGPHPASCTMDNGSFPGVKRLGREADYLPSSSAAVMEE